MPLEFWKSILLALCINNSIIDLNLPDNNLSKSYSQILNIISSNKTILFLNLRNGTFSINEDFGQALVGNHTLIKINLALNDMNNPHLVIPLLIQSRIQKIYYDVNSLPENISKMISENHRDKFSDLYEDRFREF